jgi:hypothetical protein
LQQWFFDIPVVTRFLFVASFVVSLAGAYGAVSAYRLTLAWPLIIHNFELYVLLVCLGRLSYASPQVAAGDQLLLPQSGLPLPQ